MYLQKYIEIRSSARAIIMKPQSGKWRNDIIF